jgi:hypothetical protein
MGSSGNYIYPPPAQEQKRGFCGAHAPPGPEPPKVFQNCDYLMVLAQFRHNHMFSYGFRTPPYIKTYIHAYICIYICVCIWAKINCGHDDTYDVFPVPEAIRAPRKSKIYVFQSGRYTYTYIFNIYWRSAFTCNAGVHGDLRGRTCIRAHRPPLHVPVESYIIDCGSGDPVEGVGDQ